MQPQDIQLSAISETIVTQGTQWGLKIIAALALWFIGRWIIKLIGNFFQKLLTRGDSIDKTLASYLRAIISWLLTIMLILTILGIFGVETTSFAALLAGAGLAIGTAWGGLLTHFAAGIFLQFLRPFKIGDSIALSGVTGTVANIGVFTTTVIASGNIETIIPNGKIIGDNIQNFTTQPYRQTSSSVTLPYGTNVQEITEKIQQQLPKISNILQTPAPSVSIAEFATTGVRLNISASGAPEHLGAIQTEMNRIILEVYPAS